VLLRHRDRCDRRPGSRVSPASPYRQVAGDLAGGGSARHGEVSGDWGMVL